MKSKRRHELATNELADWLVHIPQWYNENKRTVIIGAIVVIALIGYTIFYYGFYGKGQSSAQTQIAGVVEQLERSKAAVLQGQQENMDASGMFFNTAGALADAAKKAESAELSALAMIKRAQALRAELHYRRAIPEEDVRNSQLSQAEGIYQQALEKARAGGDMTLAAMAEYGSGLCMEDLGQLSQAEKIYNQIAANPDYAGTIYPGRAKIRADIVESLDQRVFLVKSKPAPAPVEQVQPEPSNEQLLPEANQPE